MKIENAIKKLSKLGNVEKNKNGQHWIKFNNHVISFWVQDGNVHCINCRHENDINDTQSDYFAGIYCDNISEAIRLANREKQEAKI